MVEATVDLSNLHSANGGVVSYGTLPYGVLHCGETSCSGGNLTICGELRGILLCGTSVSSESAFLFRIG